MSKGLRTTLYVVMLVCSGIIGMRVYLEMAAHDENMANMDDIQTGAVTDAAMPEKLKEFTLNDQWGEPHSITEWAGKPLLINFWATWCAPCRREMPLFEALHQQRKDIQVLGIAIDRPNDVQTFMAEAGISYPTLVGEADAMKVSDQFGLDGLGLPFTVAVSGAGDILTVFIGEIDPAELNVLSETMLKVEQGQLDIEAARQRLQTP